MTPFLDPVGAVALVLGGAAALAVLVWPVQSRSGRPGGGPAARRHVEPGRWRTVRAGLRLGGRDGPTAAEGEVLLLDGLAAALEAGLPTGRALQLALEVSPGVDTEGRGWEDLRRAARHGHPLAPAWARLARQTGSPTIGSVARAWAVAARSGAPLASAVRTSAVAARERRRLERAVDVATAGARATAAVLGLLPLAGVGLAAVLGVAPSRLYGSPAALASASAGLVLLVLGQVVVRRMVAAVRDGIR